MDITNKKYFAFISYSHMDERWGKKLHRSLETYSIPKKLVGTCNSLGEPVPKKIFPVFRDRDELPVSGDLNENIKTALASARFLIVICSPNAANSKWVNEEVRLFKKIGGEGRILPFIVDGEPNVDLKPGWQGPRECFPEALKYKADISGELTSTRIEPVCADARRGKDGAVIARMKLVAGILEIGYDVLKDRENQRRIRRMTLTSTLLFGAMLLFLGLAWKVRLSDLKTRATLSMSDFLVGSEKADAGNIRTAMAYWGRALRYDPKNDLAKDRIASALVVRNWCWPEAEKSDSNSYYNCFTFSPDGASFLTISDSLIVQCWDARTGKEIGKSFKPFENGFDAWADPGSISAAFSPDGKLLVTTSKDEMVAVWDLYTQKQIGRPLKCWASSAAFSPDCKTILAIAYDSVYIWDYMKGSNIGVPIAHSVAPNTSDERDETEITCASFSPDGELILTASKDGTARIWDSGTGTQLFVLKGHEGPINSAEFSPDGKKIVTASDDWRVRVWESGTGKELSVFFKHQAQVKSARFSPDGERIITASNDETARIWYLKTGEEVIKPLEHGMAVVSGGFSPDGKIVTTISNQNIGYYGFYVRMWEASTGEELSEPMYKSTWIDFVIFGSDGRSIRTGGYSHVNLWIYRETPRFTRLRHYAWVKSASFTPDGTKAITISEDSTLAVWDIIAANQLLSIPKQSGSINSVDVSSDGMLMVTACNDKTARILDVRTGRQTAEPLRHEWEVSFAAFSPNGKRIVTASKDGTARVWDARTGEPLTKPLMHHDDVSSAAFSPDGRRIVTASDDRTARIWDALTGEPLTKPLMHDDDVSSAAFSPDGNFIVTASHDHAVRMWDARTGKQTAQPFRCGDIVYSAAFSPDGKLIAIAGRDNIARICDARTMRQLRGSMNHDAEVFSAIFSSDGKYLITASRDYTVRIWDIRTGKQVSEPLVHGFEVHSMAVSPDGMKIITTSGDHFAYLWDVGYLTAPLSVSHLATLAELLADSTLDDNSVPRKITSDVVKRYKSLAAKPSASGDPSGFFTWLFANPLQRNISPFSRKGTREYIEELIADVNEESLREAELLGRYDAGITDRVDSKRRIHALWEESNNFTTYEHSNEKALNCLERATVEIEKLRGTDSLISVYKGTAILNNLKTADLLSTLGRYADAGRCLFVAESLHANMRNSIKLYPFGSTARWFADSYALYYGKQAWQALLDKRFDAAIGFSHKAISYDSARTSLHINLAHGYLLVNQFEKAKTIYLTRCLPSESGGYTYLNEVIEDYARFRELGVNHPDMAKIERLLNY